MKGTQAMTALTTTQQGAVLTLTLSRPEVRNAFNDEVIAEITAAFLDAASRAEVRAVVRHGRAGGAPLLFDG